MTSIDYYLFTGISARLILNAGDGALTRTSIFFNTHNSTNQYFLTCNLILTAIQWLRTQREWGSNISICSRKTLPLWRFGSASVLQRHAVAVLLHLSHRKPKTPWSVIAKHCGTGLRDFFFSCRAIITMHLLCFIFVVLFRKCWHHHKQKYESKQQLIMLLL